MSKIGTVNSLTGVVRAISPDGQERVLHVGDKVYLNERIETGTEGSIFIAFDDGTFLDLGRDAQITLDAEAITPEAAPTQAEAAAAQSAMAEVAAMQAALERGEEFDPTKMAEAAAAGGVPGAGGAPGENIGHTFVSVEYLNPEATPTAGFDTTGPSVAFPAPEDVLLLTPEEPEPQEPAPPAPVVPPPEPPNVAPLAAADTHWVAEDTSLAAEGNVLQTIVHTGAPSGSFGDVADTDVNLDALTVNTVNGSAANVGTAIAGLYGTLTLNSDGSYSYTLNNAHPSVQVLDTGETISDVFTYTATDGTAISNQVNLIITIFGTNDVPVANADTHWVTEDVNLIAEGNVLQNLSHTGAPSGSFGDVADSDVDLEALTVNAVSGSAANVGAAVAGLYGTLTLNADGSYGYTLNNAHPAVQALDTGETITDVFTYTATDGTATSNQVNLSITIFGTNDVPVAAADTHWVAEDTSLTAVGNVLQTLSHTGAPSGSFGDVADSDVDLEALTVNAVSGSAANVGAAVAGLYGTLTLNADGSYGYTLNNAHPAVQALDTGETITDVFTYTATDGTATSNTVNLAITIFGTNDIPVAAADTHWAMEDTSLVAEGNVLQTLAHTGAPSGSFGDVADTDVDLEALTVNTVNGSVANVSAAVAGLYGTLTLNSDGSYNYALNNAHPVVQALDTGETITDVFTYTATDGTATSNQVTLAITIFGTNDVPVANADTHWVAEDTSLTAEGNVLQTLAHTGAPSGSFGDVADTDVDLEALTVNAVNGSAANVSAPIAGLYGTLTLNSDGSYNYALNNAHPVVQALDTGETITDVFTYTATDGTATSNTVNLAITIFGTNDIPVAVADTHWAMEDTGETPTTPDAEGNVLQTLAHTGAPFGVFGDVADTDVDLEALTVNSVNGSAANVGSALAGLYGTLMLNIDGSYSYTVNDANPAVQALDDGETINDVFTYTATDGTATSNPATLTITIFGTNDVPVANADTNWVWEDNTVTASGNVLQTIAHPGAPSGIFGDVADTDVDVEALTVNSVNGAAANVGMAIAGLYGTLMLNSDGSYSYTLYTQAENADAYNAVQALDDGETLPDVFHYTATDGTATSNQVNLDITIFGTNDAPLVGTGLAVVSEEGLPKGIADTIGAPDTTDEATFSGVIPYTDVDLEIATVTLSAPLDMLTSESVPITWSGDGTSGNPLIGMANGETIVTITITSVTADAINYKVVLSGPLDHPSINVEDVKEFVVGVHVNDGTVTTDSTLTVYVEDDAPIAFFAAPGVLFNGPNNVATAPLNSLTAIGADDYATGRTNVTFAESQEGVSGLTSNGDAIYLYVSPDGKTLTGSTATTEAESLTNPSKTVYTVSINDATDNYTMMMFGSIDNGAGIEFSNLSGTGPAGNPPWKIVESSTPDSTEILFTPLGTATTINSDADDVGVSGGQTIGEGEGIRFDFGNFTHNLNGPGPADDTFAIDAKSTINGFSFNVHQIVGSTVAALLTAYDANSPLDNVLTNDIQDVINRVVVYDNIGTKIAEWNAGEGDTTVGGIGFDDMGDGRVAVSGLDVGYRVVTFTADGYDSLGVFSQATDGTKFSISNLEVLTIDTGEPVPLSFDAILTDADGDTSTGTIDVIVMPSDMVLSSLNTNISGSFAAAGTFAGSEAGQVFAASSAPDTLIGGTGFDVVDYTEDTFGVNVDLETGVGSGGTAEGDTYTSIEGVIGGTGDDTLIGDTGDNTLIGGGGDDTLAGGAGDDTLQGGIGSDQIDWSDATGPIIHSLGEEGETESADLGDVGLGTDTYTGMEGIIGGEYADQLTGNEQPNILYGGGGDDTLVGGGGSDTLIGGSGADHLTGGEAGSTPLTPDTSSDIFVFRSEDLGSGVDVIEDFHAGTHPDAGGDVLDLSSLLQGTAAEGNLEAAFNNNYLSLTDDGTGINTVVNVDVTGGGDSFQAVAVLMGVNPVTAMDDLQDNIVV